MASRLILRFDIDTVACIKRGVPALLEFSDQYDLPMTFFANLGRAVSWPGVFRSRLKSSKEAVEKAQALGARQKLGWPDLLKTMIFDPMVGAIGKAELQAIEARGHDLGLHGGRNHSAWHHGAKDWSEDRLRREVQWGVNRMEQLGLKRPRLFASPGFTHPEKLLNVLRDLSFTVIADEHGWGMPALDGRGDHRPLRVSTGILGEPGGVGFVEHVVAKGMSEGELAELLINFIESNQTFVLYDHPCFSGCQGLPVLKAVVDCWQKLGGEFCLMSDLTS